MDLIRIDKQKLKSKCINCGRKIPFNANFCPYCCKRLRRDKSQELIKQHEFLVELLEELIKKRKNVNN